MADENYKWDEGGVEDCPYSSAMIPTPKKKGEIPMHIRTLQHLTTLPQRRIHTNLMRLQRRPRRVNTLRYERARRTGC